MKIAVKIIKESKKPILEGLLEDPIEQSGSVILSMLDAQGFRTRGFMESLVNTLRMNAEEAGMDPIEAAEAELDNLAAGLDDLKDRISGRLMTYFPRTSTLAAAQAETETDNFSE